MKDKYGTTIFYSLIVVISWGLVPGLAKMGSLSTGLTTMYVNWFAVFCLGFLLIVKGRIKEFKKPKPYGKYLLIGLLWPLAYSIAYFGAIDLGGACLTTITNYVWPAIFLSIGSFWGKKFTGQSWFVVIIAISAVAIPILLEGSLILLVFPIVLGLTAATAQACYSFITENVSEDPLLITFIIEVVTALGATLYVMILEKFVVPNIVTLGYLSIIGVISNGIGFWAFLKAGQVSNTERTKTLFLLLMCLTPIIQVVILPLLRVEEVTFERWVGVALIALALLLYRLPLSKKPSV